ncbi:MAG: hypothetical protein KF708_15495 [Pirellulales bacterium]|nr:hypothetical protein [Pirellulales bacterium]
MCEAACTPNGAGGACSTTVGAMPGRICVLICDVTTLPSFDSKRATRLILRWGPPTSSHGIHTLYECPIFDLL